MNGPFTLRQAQGERLKVYFQSNTPKSDCCPCRISGVIYIALEVIFALTLTKDSFVLYN